ncbi:hypothetical protein GNP81_14445 [Aliivibrio fischeri]|uniref:BatD family protein n=1 Tax=Aliivibrio fischeri TaxID=668 RepID=UPI0012D97039|nr:BatD family protein [Aliivibrio fischeri]MUK61740.1 hypothetical protein [Aliivibrio fischeri]MUL21989.1 hypothetical protein [Aliivibrio fischeri]MUL25796.1 hypothetical protein [Aliivibrio fischeri]
MRQISFFLFLLLSATSFSLYAREEASPTLRELVNNKITITSWLNSDKNKTTTVAINQPVILTVDIATPRWFTDGTAIERISIPNIITQQRNLQATNYSLMDGEQTWSHQRWEIPLFPQKSGQFTVPSIGVKVTVSVKTGKSITGILFTQPHRFSAKRPTSQMTNPDEWIVAPKASLTQEWQYISSTKNKINTPNDNKTFQLKVGDVITRTTVLEVPDSLAMLLPTVIPNEKINALQRYTDPVQLIDKNTRGNFTSIKKESETYILQKGGKVTLPPISIPFWNTTTQQSETLFLEGKTFIVKHTLISWLAAYWYCISLFLISSTILVLLTKKIRLYYRTHPYPDFYLLCQSMYSHAWPSIRLYIYRKYAKKTDQLELKKYQPNNKKEWDIQSENLQTSEISKIKTLWIWFKIKK